MFPGIGMATMRTAQAYLVGYSVEAWKEEPETRIEDAYKWLFHACLGGEHAITDEPGVRAWLDEEWETLVGPLPGEKMLTVLRPDGAVVRLNLRPFKAAGGSKGSLHEVFINGAREFASEKTIFVGCWHVLGEWLRESESKLITHNEWKRLDSLARANDYPAIHHSSDYEQAVKPAYRVLTGALSSDLLSLL